ncbi:homoserine/homoserine lactone efflux protein [Halomonas sp. A11-A]|uniref:homoserine/homoserine lactone efflux protein n=1 Tax=Halomonas sp. A11-A TaxID=2183985 RepID=UPI000D716475|nr:homoserine/homoserine lactone efflux protein [Halomonas sp. A11-A]PWV76775.1 homoserine/homoserine lactone efflux protein [Halomonas sp. A11-A]
MTLGVWLTFLMASFFVSISPGAGAINTINSGINNGVKSALPTILGLQLGYGIQILAVAIGIGAVLASSTTIFSFIKWMGVAYLIWLGVQKWRSPSSLGNINNDENTKKKQFWKSFFVNLTNPKATVFLVALFPQFLSNSSSSSHISQLLIMGGTLLAVDIIVMFCYAELASQLKRFINSTSRIQFMNRAFGSFFIIAAIMLAAYKKT